MKTASQPRHLNLWQAQNIQYQIYVFYFVHVLYKKLLYMLGKSVKHVSPIAKGFSWYIYWNSTASKIVSCLCTPQTQDNIFVRCRFWWEFFYCFGVNVTTIFRRNGYITRSVVHTICYTLKGTHWWYNHVHKIWRG